MNKKKQQQQLRSKQKNQLLQNFMSHCATVIQSHYKGYIQRKYYKKFLPIYRRLKQILQGAYRGWKVRKIFKLNLIKNKIKEIKDNQKSLNLMQVRIKKRDLTDQINRLGKNGAWVYYFKKQNKNPLGNKNLHAFSNNQIQKMNLKTALGVIPKQNKQKKDKSVNKQNNLTKSSSRSTLSTQKSLNKQSGKASTISVSKNTRNSKFQAPPILKKHQIKKLSKDQKKLSIQISMQPELKQINQITCQTPSQNVINIKQFSFYTKTNKENQRTKIKEKKTNPYQNFEIQSRMIQSDQSFKGITILSTRKGGLHLTLSKKSIQEDSLHPNDLIQMPKINGLTSSTQPGKLQVELNQPNKISSRVLNQFTKKKPQSKQYNQLLYQVQHTQSSKQKQIRSSKFYEQKQQPQNPLKDSILKFKTDQFQRKKQQYLQKVQNFKKPTFIK